MNADKNGGIFSFTNFAHAGGADIRVVHSTGYMRRPSDALVEQFPVPIGRTDS